MNQDVHDLLWHESSLLEINFNEQQKQLTIVVEYDKYAIPNEKATAQEIVEEKVVFCDVSQLVLPEGQSLFDRQSGFDCEVIQVLFEHHSLSSEWSCEMLVAWNDWTKQPRYQSFGRIYVVYKKAFRGMTARPCSKSSP